MCPNMGESELRQLTAAELVKAMAAELNALATEFDHRVSYCTREVNLHRPAQAGTPPHEVARKLLAQRRLRAEFFPAELFHEPAWDMLLALFIADDERQTLNVKALVATTLAPITTSQRWIDHLHKLKLIQRITDPLDRRRTEVSLSYTGQLAVLAYLEHVGAD